LRTSEKIAIAELRSNLSFRSCGIAIAEVLWLSVISWHIVTFFPRILKNLFFTVYAATFGFIFASK
jgi:hypothetical protein